MAYTGIINTAIQNNASRYLYTVTEALKLAGWRVMAWGGGASTTAYAAYNPSGVDDNVLTSETAWSSGGQGGAWKVLKEPSPGTREFCFFRGTAFTSPALVQGFIKYSRATGFVSSGATPAGPSVAPTTGTGGDGQVIVGTGTDATTITLSNVGNVCEGNAPAGTLQVVASNTPINGVWGFWAFLYPNAETISTAFFLEPMAVGSCSSADPDPCAIYYQTDTTRQAVGSYTYNTGGWKCWFNYGNPAGYFYTAAACGYMASNLLTSSPSVCFMPSLSASQNPYDGTIPMYPFMITGGRVGISPGVTAGNFVPKGLTACATVFGVSQTVGDTFNLSTSEPRIAVLCAPTVTSPFQLAVPWIPNQVPTQY
jgi:hypothetical protein